MYSYHCEVLSVWSRTRAVAVMLDITVALRCKAASGLTIQIGHVTFLKSAADRSNGWASWPTGTYTSVQHHAKQYFAEYSE
jgi:hypothetical protein